jgi:hypothetical protein
MNIITATWREKVTSIEHQTLKNQIGKRYRICQVYEFEGCHVLMKHNTYCKTYCVCLCIVGHTPSQELELKKIDDNPVTEFSWLCPNTNLTCWEKFHKFSGPRGLFTNPGRIIDTYTGCFRFGHKSCHVICFCGAKLHLENHILSEGIRNATEKRMMVTMMGMTASMFGTTETYKRMITTAMGMTVTKILEDSALLLMLFWKHDTGLYCPNSVIAVCSC